MRQHPGMAVIVMTGGVQRLFIDGRGDNSRGLAAGRHLHRAVDVLERRLATGFGQDPKATRQPVDRNVNDTQGTIACRVGQFQGQITGSNRALQRIMIANHGVTFAIAGGHRSNRLHRDLGADTRRVAHGDNDGFVGHEIFLV